MPFIEIPYQPDAPNRWTVPIPGDGSQHFSSREEALAFAIDLIKKERSDFKEANVLCIEGADGKWRLFTADLLPVK